MNRIYRKRIPSILQDTDKGTHNYLNLRDASNKIKPRWNTMTECGEKIIRKELHEISKGCCAYCGKKITLKEMDIDHFLPSSKFPYLSYCWDNFLPSCKVCNQSFKRDLSPSNLQNLNMIERYLKIETLEDKGIIIKNPFLFKKKTVLKKIFTEDRIIDPSFDLVKNHLEFNPIVYKYRGRTKIGDKTAAVFFSNVEFQESIEGVSNIVLGLVYNGNPFGVIQDLIDTYGYKFYYEYYWRLWNKKKIKNTKYYQLKCKDRFEQSKD